VNDDLKSIVRQSVLGIGDMPKCQSFYWLCDHSEIGSENRHSQSILYKCFGGPFPPIT